MRAGGNENFRAPGEHGFSFFQVKMFTGSVSVLLTSPSLKIKILKKKYFGAREAHLIRIVFSQHPKWVIVQVNPCIDSVV